MGKSRPNKSSLAKEAKKNESMRKKPSMSKIMNYFKKEDSKAQYKAKGLREARYELTHSQSEEEPHLPPKSRRHRKRTNVEERQYDKNASKLFNSKKAPTQKMPMSRSMSPVINRRYVKPSRSPTPPPVQPPKQQSQILDQIWLNMCKQQPCNAIFVNKDFAYKTPNQVVSCATCSPATPFVSKQKQPCLGARNLSTGRCCVSHMPSSARASKTNISAERLREYLKTHSTTARMSQGEQSFMHYKPLSNTNSIERTGRCPTPMFKQNQAWGNGVLSRSLSPTINDRHLPTSANYCQWSRVTSQSPSRLSTRMESFHPLNTSQTPMISQMKCNEKDSEWDRLAKYGRKWSELSNRSVSPTIPSRPGTNWSRMASENRPSTGVGSQWCRIVSRSHSPTGRMSRWSHAINRDDSRPATAAHTDYQEAQVSTQSGGAMKRPGANVKTPIDKKFPWADILFKKDQQKRSEAQSNRENKSNSPNQATNALDEEGRNDPTVDKEIEWINEVRCSQPQQQGQQESGQDGTPQTQRTYDTKYDKQDARMGRITEDKSGNSAVTAAETLAIKMNQRQLELLSKAIRESVAPLDERSPITVRQVPFMGWTKKAQALQDERDETESVSGRPSPSMTSEQTDISSVRYLTPSKVREEKRLNELAQVIRSSVESLDSTDQPESTIQWIRSTIKNQQVHDDIKEIQNASRNHVKDTANDISCYKSSRSNSPQKSEHRWADLANALKERLTNFYDEALEMMGVQEVPTTDRSRQLDRWEDDEFIVGRRHSSTSNVDEFTRSRRQSPEKRIITKRSNQLGDIETDRDTLRWRQASKSNGKEWSSATLRSKSHSPEKVTPTYRRYALREIENKDDGPEVNKRPSVQPRNTSNSPERFTSYRSNRKESLGRRQSSKNNTQVRSRSQSPKKINSGEKRKIHPEIATQRSRVERHHPSKFKLNAQRFPGTSVMNRRQSLGKRMQTDQSTHDTTDSVIDASHDALPSSANSSESLESRHENRKTLKYSPPIDTLRQYVHSALANPPSRPRAEVSRHQPYQPAMGTQPTYRQSKNVGSPLPASYQEPYQTVVQMPRKASERIANYLGSQRRVSQRNTHLPDQANEFSHVSEAGIIGQKIGKNTLRRSPVKHHERVHSPVKLPSLEGVDSKVNMKGCCPSLFPLEGLGSDERESTYSSLFPMESFDSTEECPLFTMDHNGRKNSMDGCVSLFPLHQNERKESIECTTSVLGCPRLNHQFDFYKQYQKKAPTPSKIIPDNVEEQGKTTEHPTKERLAGKDESAVVPSKSQQPNQHGQSSSPQNEKIRAMLPYLVNFTNVIDTGCSARDDEQLKYQVMMIVSLILADQFCSEAQSKGEAVTHARRKQRLHMEQMLREVEIETELGTNRDVHNSLQEKPSQKSMQDMAMKYWSYNSKDVYY